MNTTKRRHLRTQKRVIDIKRKHEILLDVIDLYYNHEPPYGIRDVLSLDDLVDRYGMSDKEIWWLHSTAFKKYDMDLMDWFDHIYWGEW